MQCFKLLPCIFLVSSVLAFGSCDYEKAESKNSQSMENGYYPIEYHHIFDSEDCKSPKTTPTPPQTPAPDSEPKSQLSIATSVVLHTKPYNAK